MPTRRLIAASAVWFLALASCSHTGGRGGVACTSATASAETITVVLDTTLGDITLELDPVHAPIGTGNFLNHALKQHYDGTVFHRTVPGFVIQGGGWNPDLTDRGRIARDAGDPEDTIINEWTNGLKNVRGTIAWARDAEPNTATREFYINVADNAKLDGPRPTTGNAGYAVFGRVVKGMDVVDRIVNVPTTSRPDISPEDGGLKNVPVEPVIIRRVVRVKP